MTKPRDPDALLSAYLVEGMQVLPDRVIDSVLDEVHRTRQRAVFGPRRTTSFRSALGAAAVVAAVVLGTAILVIQGSRPAVVAPSPTAAASPSASQPAVIGPSASPAASEPVGPSAGPTSSAVAAPGGVWIATGTMGTPRYGHTAVRLLDGRVLVVGGGNNDENDTSAELYDPDSGTWSATGNMVHPRGGFPVFPPTLLRDGRVLVGDYIDENTDDDIDGIGGAELYDPNSGTWTATSPKVKSGGSTATLLRDGRVLVIGYDNTGELYDPDSGAWTATGKMTTPRHSHAAILLPDGKVLVAGGHAPADDPTDSAELYDPETGSWTAIANMHVKRGAITAFLQPDGKVLVIGQARGDPQTVESYDPATRTWTATEDTSGPGVAVNELATLLSDGRVLAADARPDSPAAELYDPGTGSWTTTAPMLRSHGTPATLLLDGTVLVAGGRDCLDGVCVATGSAELYVPRGVSPPPLPAFPSPPPPVIPSPTPRPTPFPPEAGPVPPNARTWTVRVVNKSSDPATLFMVEEDENGIAKLCGSVSPNVVPAGVTKKVTFLLPRKSVTGCWIWVNPVPGEGGSLFETSDAPLAGEIFVTADGQAGWLGR